MSSSRDSLVHLNINTANKTSILFGSLPELTVPLSVSSMTLEQSLAVTLVLKDMAGLQLISRSHGW